MHPRDGPRQRPPEMSEGGIGVIAGLQKELACLTERAGVYTFAAAGDGERAAAAADDMIFGRKVAALLSFGLAGGLDPALKAGDVVIPVQIIGEDGTTSACDARLCAALQTLVDGGHAGSLAGASRVVASPRDKASLFHETGALAVDMESHAVAATAARHDIPFAALRVVVDTASEAIPPVALLAMRPDGSLDEAAVRRALARRPWELPRLIALGRASRIAFARLREIGARGPAGALMTALND